MIRIIKGEFRKIWQCRAFWIVIVIAIVINVGYIQIGTQISSEITEEQSDVPSPGAYKKFDKVLAKEKNKNQFIEDYYRDIQGLLLVEQIQNYLASESEMSVRMAEGMLKENQEDYALYLSKWRENNYPIYTDNLETEKIFAEEIYKKYTDTKDYSDYLEDVFEQEEEKLDISIFANHHTDSFSENVIRKTSEKYQTMKGTETNFYTYQWLEKGMEDEITDILIVLSVFIIAMVLVFEDKRKNLFAIIRATPRGRGICIFSKIVTLAVSTFGVTVVMYFALFGFLSINYGIAGINEEVQSVSLFLSCPYHLKVWQFLLITVVLKSVTFFVIALWMLLISLLASHYVVPFTSGMAVVLINGLMYYSFTSVGKYNILHYLNLWSFVKIENLLGNYVLLKIMGTPVSAMFLAFLLEILLLWVLVFANVTTFIKMKKMPEFSNKIRFYWGRKGEKKKICVLVKWIRDREGSISKNLVCYEAKKIYRISGCALVMILFVGGMIISGATTKCYLSPNQESYRQQMKELEGQLTEEKEKMVLEKKEYYDDIFKQLEHLEEKLEQGKIEEELYESMKLSLESKLALYPAFVRVYERYQYVKKNEDAQFVYEDGYKKMIGRMDGWYIDFIFVMVMVLIIIQSTVFTLDKDRNMEKLIRATPKGRKESVACKMGIGIFNGVILYLSLVFRNVYIADKFYGTDLWGTSLSNIKGYENIPNFVPISLGGLLFIFVGLMFVTLVSATIMFVSAKIGNAIGAIVMEEIILCTCYICFIYFI